ncbi:hypothetical protein MARPO_0017s0030 [Marchantia polymorpha]|uniref:Gnk2-homologous domain-containing protein n=1 Tax=Marchantia polymorpha TaxID=3197 RepID=A0A2R6XFN2_MARPO|nr:hypothetical protein MARPO_0017s0030 [Marchantia polymorpha]|eukprot:PTQ44913.1 hypothetical protein MARPO_0017s0030 [Marchantia polymorpha]
MSILLALSFLALFQMPHLSSAVPGGLFRFQRFSAAELPQSVGLAPAILERNRSAVPASHRNCSALRGVRKLLDLSLTQGPVSSTSGIPTFYMQIVNLCGACAMADIHVACGAWASATASVFTRLGYNDCLVNSGQPVSSHGGVSFQYSSSAIAIATNECSR